MHYAKIEKEALAATWACETLGKRFSIETEHKPLVSLFGTKKLDSLPPTILRFRLCLARFDYTIAHIPGKELCVADTLSPAQIAAVSNDSELQEEADYLMEVGVCNVPVTRGRLQQYQAEQETDPICTQVRKYCVEGWPDERKNRATSSGHIGKPEATYLLVKRGYSFSEIESPFPNFVDEKPSTEFMMVTKEDGTIGTHLHSQL